MACKYSWIRHWFTNLSFSDDFSTLPEMRNISCLILLGEPGSGKTCAIKTEWEQLRDNLQASSDKALYFNLEAFDSGELVNERVFKHPAYQDWKSASHRLYLFLDSLDKTRLPLNVMAELIADELRSVPVERLFLRVACRSADWPASLEAELNAIWRKLDKPRTGELERVPNSPYEQRPRVVLCHLVHLKYHEVMIASRQEGLDSGKFWAAVSHVNALPLTLLPITLDILLRTYRRGEKIPESRVSLFYAGCQELLAEATDARKQSFGTSLDRRFTIATLIAAVTVFCNRYAVSVSVDSHTHSHSDVSLHELLTIDSSIKEQELYETLDSSLFISEPGGGKRVWIHQAYAEFLAAFFITSNKVPEKDILRLATTKDGAIAPQLYDTFAWLAEIQPRLIHLILKLVPDVFVRSDFSHVTAADFRNFLQNLLSEKSDHYFLYLREPLRRGNPRPANSTLTNVVGEFLVKQKEEKFFRQFLLLLVHQYRMTGLDELLLEIVFNQNEDEVTRRFAIDALYEVGSDESKGKLKPFIYGVPEDSDDELKGYALLSLWPTHLTGQELFQVLTLPKRPNFFGAYSMFLSPHRIVTPLSVDDFTFALEWIEAQPASHQTPLAFRDIVDAIMIKAWHYLDDLGVLKAYARAAVSRYLHYDELVEGHIHIRTKPNFQRLSLKKL